MKIGKHVLRNKSGMTLCVSDLGGLALSLSVPDRHGRFEDILLGYPKPEQYGYMNALIGRVGNRISGGGFSLDGDFFKLVKNSGKAPYKCTLHGGTKGFDQKIWSCREFAGADGPSLELTTFSPDGEEGFPGNLSVRVVYTLMEGNAWRIQYWAVTDKPTVVNLTQHAYFNLTGCKRDIGGHFCRVNASRFTDVDAGLIPTGRERSVKGTGMDLREGAMLGERFAAAAKDPVMAGPNGYDHNFVLDRVGDGLEQAAVLEDQASGRRMEVWTTEPGVQIYTANMLPSKPVGKKGRTYGVHWGICFESQHAPDSPNQPGFRSIRLNPGEVYTSTTIYAFSTFE